MYLSLGKDDGHELEERVADKLRSHGFALGQRGQAVRLAVDVFAEWLKEQEAPPVDDDLTNRVRALHEVVTAENPEPGFAAWDAINSLINIVPELAGAHDRYLTALNRLNQLRKNITATQRATWSNAMYPMVAILNDAGFEDDRVVSEEQKEAHLNAYGGAGKFPEAE